ncbi:hypothetical protein [Methylocaldum sp. RMAD-M]|uniref:hypothetical protein n=1 Tax=Methylocaldum sp. RMAD-M TaxID=2806557 RepID=UPI00143D7E3A|nr:hypothetical protein [Methylocaldum sp. RMAD-M]MBP1149348.1 hypothetical protein [Methylocaldum sp. RMAD-M]MDV3240446.1 hypothetical protein [Methylocaldum sp.]
MAQKINTIAALIRLLASPFRGRRLEVFLRHSFVQKEIAESSAHPLRTEYR